MKFLLDVCASSRALRALLTDLNHDVVSAIDVDPRASDEVLLDLAMQEQRVFVTEDKDFGELVFVHRLPHPCIIRFLDMRVEEKAAAMREVLDRYQEAMQAGALIVVSRGRIRCTVLTRIIHAALCCDRHLHATSVRTRFASRHTHGVAHCCVRSNLTHI